MPTYRDVFFAANGFGPYECFFCHEEVTFDEVTVHHLDEVSSRSEDADHGEDHLAASHSNCHLSHHAKERISRMSPEERAAMADRVPKEVREDTLRRLHEEKDENGKSIAAVRAGKAAAAKRTPEQASALGRLAADAKWKKHGQADA